MEGPVRNFFFSSYMYFYGSIYYGFFSGLSGRNVTSKFSGIAFLSDYNAFFETKFNFLQTSKDGLQKEEVFHK